MAKPLIARAFSFAGFLLRRLTPPTPPEPRLPAEAETPSPPEELIDPVLDAVKLIHSSELGRLERFERYQDRTATTYGEYLRNSERIAQLRQSVARYLEAEEQLSKLDGDTPVEYDRIGVDVPGSWLPCPRFVTHRLDPPLPDTIIAANSGVIEGPSVRFKRRLFARKEWVVYSSPSRHVYADHIARHRQVLASTSPADAAAFAEVKTSVFSHPVLFISHRWESVSHPDPRGEQLAQLRSLTDCWMIYDYCAFPQHPRSAGDEETLAAILHRMDELIDKVVVLRSPDYLERGWCIYEYIVASLKGALTCDEIAAEDFVALREWVATTTPIPLNLWRDSYESMQQNHINEQILGAVNRVLPLFQRGAYTEERDRALVRQLLVTHLKAVLPAKKEHVSHFGEWKTVRWTDEELQGAFETQLTWEHQQTMDIARQRLDVPRSLEEASQRKYQVPRGRFGDKLMRWIAVLGSGSAPF